MRVAAVIPSGDGVILVRHEKDGECYHLLPGGGVEPGETLGAALSRELLEETGLVCEALAPLFVNDSIAPDGARHVIQITFLARPIGAGPTDHATDARVATALTVPFSDLADLDLRPPMAEALLEAAANGYAGPARYLGPLWSDPTTGITETGQTPVTDR